MLARRVLMHCFPMHLIHFQFHPLHPPKKEKKKSILHLCLPWQQVIIHSYEGAVARCVAEIQTFVSAGSLMMAAR